LPGDEAPRRYRRLCCLLRKGNTERERGRKRGILIELPPVGKEKERRCQDKEEERRRTDGIFQGLISNFRKLQGPFCKVKFPINPNPNEEMLKMKVGEFFKLYNIALGPKFKNSKLISFHVKF
jgi:hypothetical protein